MADIPPIPGSSSLFDTAAASPSPTTPVGAVDEEFYSSWSLLIVCVLLIMSLWTSYYLQIKRIRAIHETLVSIFAGMAVGLVVRIAGPGSVIQEMLTFKHTLFFNLLLPPIILNSGYELKQENFFRNFGSILTFAFLGTFISAVGVGVLVYIYQFLGLEGLEISLIECLAFGSTLSATDPVTILAIFNQYKVDPKLYTIIFGESLLNDAVSIVMYETLTKFHGSQIYVQSIFHGIGIFLLSFSVSMALGVVIGLLTSLVLKHSSLSLYPQIESCLVALLAYTSYFLSNGLTMSGIVSLLFCGITLKHYAYHTMSRRTQRTTKYIFATLAQLSENFIFVYLGLALFTSAPTTGDKNYVKPLFIAITTVAVIFTRYAAVFPLSEFINFFLKHARGQRQEELPHSYQMMLFWAGLRGAVGVALAAGFQGDNALTLRTTVLVVVVLTVLMFGGTTARMLEVLGIRTGVEDEGASDSDEEDNNLIGLGRPGRRRNSNAGWGYRDGGGYFEEEEPSYFASAQAYARSAARIGSHYASRSYNHHQATATTTGAFSAASASDSDSEAEVLPLATHARTNSLGSPTVGASNSTRRGTIASAPASPGGAGLTEDGKWFQALDERYLLPLFSNATASRTFHARRARRGRTSSGVSPGAAGPGIGEDAPGSGFGTPADSEDELRGRQDEVDLSGPAQNSGSGHSSLSAIVNGVRNGDRSDSRNRGSPLIRNSPSTFESRPS
ncbi:monovalent inorganic cation transporter [Moniliophthora roreri MCA 2997]|uniref:Sodium/hydrogen exchanger n=1 Tax=Moniliophthora roreri (strain MCA 2997) TaxID=1381753 RepID=V2YNS1_MONRO|nr:monovalent inorganic cation transporter [Moniliophthora roreri MCA 2997]